MFESKRTFSRLQTSVTKKPWSESSKIRREDRARSSCSVLSRSSNIDAVAATPEIATRAPVHTRGMTPENKVRDEDFRFLRLAVF